MVDGLDSKSVFSSLTSIDKLKPVNRQNNNIYHKKFKNYNDKNKDKKKEKDNESVHNTDTYVRSANDGSDLNNGIDKKGTTDRESNKKIIDIKI